MNRILEAFAQNRLYTITSDYMNNSEYETVLLRSYALKKQLTDNLSDEGKNTLDQLLEAHKEMNHMSEIEQFTHGYQLGFMMSVEAFTGINDLIYVPEEQD